MACHTSLICAAEHLEANKCVMSASKFLTVIGRIPSVALYATAHVITTCQPLRNFTLEALACACGARLLVKYDESDCNEESADAGISAPTSLKAASSGSAKILACTVGAKEFLRHFTFSSRGAFAPLHRILLATAGETADLSNFWNSVSDI